MKANSIRVGYNHLLIKRERRLLFTKSALSGSRPKLGGVIITRRVTHKFMDNYTTEETHYLRRHNDSKNKQFSGQVFVRTISALCSTLYLACNREAFSGPT